MHLHYHHCTPVAIYSGILHHTFYPLPAPGIYEFYTLYNRSLVRPLFRLIVFVVTNHCLTHRCPLSLGRSNAFKGTYGCFRYAYQLVSDIALQVTLQRIDQAAGTLHRWLLHKLMTLSS